MSTPAPIVHRLRDAARGSLRALWPTRAATGVAAAAFDVDATYFAAPVCRNCGADRSAMFCGQCGQKAAARLGAGDLRGEAWESLRWFEASLVRGGLRLLLQPGGVAREYALGARKAHVHPLKLLLVAIGLLVWLLDATHYLTAGRADLADAMVLVARYKNWSFSLGVPAIWCASMAVLRPRLRYNAVEHLVLAAYAQTAVIALNVANLLVLRIAALPVPLHRALSTYYMTPLEIAVVGFAFVQFFRLDVRRDGLRLAAALVVFVVAKKALLFGYGALITQLVLRQLG